MPDVIPLRSVFIVGKDIFIPKEVLDRSNDAECLIIGDGRIDLKFLEYSKLQDRLDKYTRIYILCHGVARGGVHYLDMPTGYLLKIIAGYCGGVPINVQLTACFAGAAAPDVVELPPGSVLITHGTSYDPTSADINDSSASRLSQDLRSSDFVQDFLLRFALHTKQYATISIRKSDGTVFKHTISPPRSTLTNPNEVRRYLEFERTRFMVAYNQAFDKKLDLDKIPPITEQEAIEWRDDNFIYTAGIGNKRVLEALRTRIHDFDDYINSSFFKSKDTALTLATRLGKDEIVSALLASDKIDTNNADWALMIALQKGHGKIVGALLVSGKISVHLVSTALISAAENDQKKVVSDALASGKIDAATKLMVAAIMGDDKEVSALLASESDKIDSSTINRALISATARGHDKVVSALLASDKIDTGIASRELMSADIRGHSKVVSVFFASDKIDANAKLMLATMRGDDAKVSALLASSSDKINAINVNNALMFAVEKGHYKVVSSLLNSASDKIDKTTANKALILAAEKGDDRVVFALLTLALEKVDLTIQNDLELTTLMVAAGNGHDKVVSVMLTLASSKIDATNANNALKRAAANGHDEVVSVLLASGKINPDTASRALISAIKYGYDKVVSVLLASGKINNVNFQDEDGYTALMWAAAMGRDNAVTSLLKLDDTKVNLETKEGDTALMIAADMNKDGAGSILFNSSKSDVNSKLMYAAMKGYDKKVSTLLASSAGDINANKALMLASERGHDRVVSVLLASGKIDFNETFMKAAMRGNDKAVSVLLASGKIDANIKNENGYTALMLASMNGHDAVVSVLHESGKSDFNLRQDGYTALMYAAMRGHGKVVDKLLGAGAIVNLRNKQGMSALDLAAQNGHKDIVDKLTPLVAKPVEINPIGPYTDKLSKEPQKEVVPEPKPHSAYTDLAGKKADIPKPVTIHTAAVQSDHKPQIR